MEIPGVALRSNLKIDVDGFFVLFGFFARLSFCYDHHGYDNGCGCAFFGISRSNGSVAISLVLCLELSCFCFAVVVIIYLC